MDRNVVSEMMRVTPEPKVIAWLDDQLEETIWITSTTVLEVRTGIELLPPRRRRATLAFSLATRNTRLFDDLCIPLINPWAD